jgi:hypothetical protein
LPIHFGTKVANPRWAFTKALKEDAISKFPQLKWELSDQELKNFLLNKDRIGLAHTPSHKTQGNGYLFAPLEDCRKAIDKLYGPQRWEAEAPEWSSTSISETLKG